MTLVRNLFYGLQIRRHRLGLRHVEPNVTFTSHSFRTYLMFRSISITCWDASCAVSELWILHWAVGFENRMAYVQERCVLLIGDLSWLSQELHPAQQGTQRFSVFPEHLSALPQSSARIREMTVRQSGSCCCSLRCMCVALSAPRKWREATWPKLRKIPLARGKRSSSMSWEEQCWEWKCTDC